MKKLINITLLTILFTLIFLYGIGSGESKLNCQYSERELVNGQCDNSDPCDPERIKIDGGKCIDDPTIKPEQKEPIKEPTDKPKQDTPPATCKEL